MKHFLTTGLSALALTGLLSPPASSQANQLDSQVPTQEAPSANARMDRLVERLAAPERASVQLYLELHDLLLEAPELVTELPALLKRGQANLEASAVLIYALEDLATSEAQQSLVSIHGDPTQRHMDRLRAVASLGSVVAPSVASLASLRAAADRHGDPQSLDLANTSLLALGRAGRRLGAQGSPLYVGVREDLLHRLRTTARRTERPMILKALGNLRDRALGGEISNYLVDESAPVRATAAQTLGMLGDPAHVEVLVELLPQEVHGAVRCAMVQGLREMPADQLSLSAIHMMVQYEKHTESRAQMVRYLVEHLRDFDESIETLREMTESDPSNQIRLLASTVLGL